MHPPRRSLSSASTANSPDRKSTAPHDTQFETSRHPRAGERAHRDARSVEDDTDAVFAGNTTSVTEKGSLPSQIGRYFLVELDPRRADIILIVCGFVGGLVDGLSFNAWGSFSSMQTGMLSAFKHTAYTV